MKADLQELEETAPHLESSQIELVRIQRELDECRHRLAQVERIFANVPGALLITDPEARIVDANAALCAMFGYEKNELLDMEPWAFVTSPRREEFLKHIQIKIIDDQTAHQVVCRRKDGQELTVEFQVAALNQAGRDLLIVSCRDVTEHKRLEERVCRSERVLAETQQLSLTGSFSWQVTTGEIHWSDETFRIYGYDPAVTPTIEMARQRIHPEDLPEFQHYLKYAPEDGRDFDFERRLLMPDGAVKHLKVVARALNDDAGQLREFVGAVMDVTAQKQSQLALEKALQESHALRDQFRLAVDTSPGLVWTALPDGSRDFHNQRWIEFTGLSFEEALGWGWQRAFHPHDLIRFENRWREAVRLSQLLETEIRLRSAGGEYRWFLVRARPLRDDQGNVIKWYGTTTDIHDRKRAETLLAGENRILELITKDSSLALILEELCHLVEQTSGDALASILLLDRTENRLWHGAAPNLPSSYTKAIDGAVIGPAAGSCGTAAFRGEPVFVSDIATDALWAEYRALALPHGLRACWSTPIFSTDRNVLGTFAIYSREPRSPPSQHHKIIEQITHLAAVAIERKRTQAALQESEERFRQMADAISEVIWITVLEPEKILYASPSFERIWGIPVSELYQNPRLWTETIHPEDRDRVTSIFKRWIAGEDIRYHDIEFRIVQPNGSIRWIHERGVLRLNAQGKPYLASGISTDVTDRKHAEEELRRSEAYLAEAQRLSLTGSFGWNVTSTELFWSKETFCILGYEPGTKPTLDLVFQRVHPEDLTFVQRTVDRASRDKTDVDFEHRVLLPDGSVKHVHVRAHAVRNELGTLEFVGAVSDITATKLAQEKLRQDERELRRITDAIPQAISVLAPDGAILYANEVVLDYTGLRLEDVKAEDFRAKLFHPDDLERFRDERQRALSRGEPFEAELRARRKDGQYRWFLVHYNPLRDEMGRVIRWYATGIDIDDRRQAEERVQKENIALREEIDHSSMFEEIVGSSAPLRKVLAQVARVAPVDSTVLILGETGTGKELIARAIHKRSKRATRAFICVNCAAIPQSLIASELFGHEKGAFTGALQKRLGRFELADGGTIFLDEIGELPAETQIALLRVLQEQEFERVGSSQTISVDVRVLAATNRDLKAAAAAGTFRQDLFYRLNVFPIQMPSLRERADDIPLLVEYLIERYAKQSGKKIRNIRKNTLELFQAYDWPGNIRELQNVIERAVILCETDTFSVDETWLKREGQKFGPAVPFVATLVEREKEIIETVLAESRGQVAGPSGAAAKLGIPRQTLESKIKTLGIDKHRFKARQAI